MDTLGFSLDTDSSTCLCRHSCVQLCAQPRSLTSIKLRCLLSPLMVSTSDSISYHSQKTPTHCLPCCNRITEQSSNDSNNHSCHQNQNAKKAGGSTHTSSARSSNSSLIETKIKISLSSSPRPSKMMTNGNQPRSLLNNRPKELRNINANDTVLINRPSGSNNRRVVTSLASYSNEAAASTTANYGDTNRNNRNVTTTTTWRSNKSQQLPSRQPGKDNTSQPANYHAPDSISNATDNNNEDNNRLVYKVPGNTVKDGPPTAGQQRISLPLIISPVTKQSYFYANQVNITKAALLNAATVTSSAQRLPIRHRFRSPVAEFFTARAVKPCYEQIADCIAADNVNQLYKWVLDGFGSQVYSWRNAPVVADSSSSSSRMREFLKLIPTYQATIEALHGAIAIGEHFDTISRRLIGKRVELLLSRDQTGKSTLHKAVLYQRPDSIRSILNLAPITLLSCDNEGRTPLHLAAFLPDCGQIYRQLVDAGAMTTATDMYFRRAEDYLQDRHHPAPSSHRHLSSTTHHLNGGLNSGIAPSIILNYGLNFAQTYGGVRPAQFDIVNDYWHTETDENFNYESCYDRWWLSRAAGGVPPPVNLSQQSTERSTVLADVTVNTSKQARLKIPPINGKIKDKAGEGNGQPSGAASASSGKMASNVALNRFNLKEIIKQGNLTALEDIVLQGNGDRLLGETSSAPLVQEFLDNLPTYLDQINELHKAAARGNVRDFQLLLDRSSLILARDPLGATPLHKATLYGHYDLAEFIVSNYGAAALDAKDNDGRTALHYAAGLSGDDRNLYQMLLKYGAKSTIIDQKQKTADFYQRFPDELNLAHIMKRSQRLNANHAINLANRIKSKSPSRRKERSLSPTVPWNSSTRSPNGSGPTNGNSSGDIDMDADVELSSNDGSVISNASTFVKRPNNSLNASQRMEVTSANLRRWIEESNIEMLEGAIIEGHGERIREKASGVFKDLDNVGSQVYIEETVPQIMNRIQNIHAAVSLGDLTSLQEGLETKKDYILSKDHLGMTPLHKATIMGHVDVVQYILEKFPETVNSRDREGRTALHYSTATTNRNGSKIYKMLIRAGADPRVRDLHGKSADYYRVHLLSLPPNETLRGQMSKASTNAKSPQSKMIGLLGDGKSRRIIQPAIREKINNALHLGNVGQLTELIIDGFGQELLGRTSFGEDARRLLKNIPHHLEVIRELQEAVINGDQDTVVRVLAENGQFAKVRDSNSFTLMHLAVIGGHMNLINYLVENFPGLTNLKDNMNRTVLHLAALTGNTDIYRRLLELGLDPKSVDQKGKTAEYYLRNNPAISSAELQELLALSNQGAPISTLQTNSRLSKMAGKSGSQPQLANGISGSSLKISSKPVRLPALSRPNGKAAKASSSEEDKREQVARSEEGQPPQNGQLEDVPSEEQSILGSGEADNAAEAENNDGGELNAIGQDATDMNDGQADDDGTLSREALNEEPSEAGTATTGQPQSIVEESESVSSERVIVYSRGEDQQWQTFDESEVAKSAALAAEQKDGAANASYEKAINQETAESESLIATGENANEGPVEGNEVPVENGDVINDANKAMASAVDTDTRPVEATEASTGVEQGEIIQTNGDKEEKEGVKVANGKASNGDLGVEEDQDHKATWSKPDDSVVEVSADHKESDLSQVFKSGPPKETDLVNKANLGPQDGEMMEVVYGHDAPAEDLVATAKRNWSAKTAFDRETKSDPQLDWEGRNSSANIRYVINEPLASSADSVLKKGKDANLLSAKREVKRPENGGVVNKEQMDVVANNAKVEKGPWPETIAEEMEQSAGDNAPTEDKLEQIIEQVTEEESKPRVNRNSDRLNELIKHWLEEGDLLRLEHVVIAGQGDRLLSVRSDDKQVQDFLNLVPAYMDKIKAVHTAVAHGNFGEVQKILTRKRFALCRDQHGASPLHLAVLHQHVDILIYIITQFPETIDGPDNDGRTPLMYAAVLPEKQIYQILETANASKETKDRFGYTARNYLTNEKLTIRDLLIKYSGKDVPNGTKADLWERPPTSEIISQLTPDTGSVPSTANGELPKTSTEAKENGEVDAKTSTPGKTVQILQIEPRARYSMELEEEAEEEQATTKEPVMEEAKVDNSEIKQESEKSEQELQVESDGKGGEKELKSNTEEVKDVAQQVAEKNTEKVIQESSSLVERNRIKRMQTFDRADSNSMKRQSSKNSDASPNSEDRTFETMSDEFSRSLRNEKIRLQKSIDRQLSSTDVIKPSGNNGSVIDSIQDASRPNIGEGSRINNGLTASGYDLTQIKDEHGRTVLHLAAAKEQKRNLFLKMLQQASYLVPERDSKYRTIRDVAVLNGIKSNLQVIDQFILDCFVKEQKDYLKMLMLEGYSQLLSVVDSEGNDVIALLKKNNITSMEPVIHELAQLQKNRDELHTFIRHGYIEGVVQLLETNGELVIAKSERGRTSLHLAVLFGNLDIIEALINANIKSVNIPDNLGRTPLHYAMAMSKMEEIGRILIHCGASKTVRDVMMRTPTFYYVYKQQIRDIKREEQNLTL